jgi:hypothetical protein
LWHDFLVSFLSVFCSTTWKTRHQNPPIDWGVGEGGRYACGLAWLIFTTAIVFLMISPNLHDIWPLFFLIPSRYETAHLLTLFRLPGDGYSLLGSKK